MLFKFISLLSLLAGAAATAPSFSDYAMNAAFTVTQDDGDIVVTGNSPPSGVTSTWNVVGATDSTSGGANDGLCIHGDTSLGTSVTGSQTNPAGISLTKTDSALTISVDNAGSTSSPWSNTASNVVTVNICVRQGFTDGSSMWNFREILVSATYDLEASFTTPQSFETRAIDPDSGAGGSFTYKVSSTMCKEGSYSSPTITGTTALADEQIFTQGDIICFEVCPEAPDYTSDADTVLEPSSVSSILTAKVTSSETGLYKFPSGSLPWYIVGGTGTQGPNNGVTATPTTDCQRMEFMLSSEFYQLDGDEIALGATAGQMAQFELTLSIDGTCLVTDVSARRGLKESRELEKLAKSEFKQDFKILMEPNDDSGSYKLKSIVAGAFTLTGAALIL